MKYTKHLVFTTAALLMLAQGFAQETVRDCLLTWEDSLRYLDPESKLYYHYRNDENNLYIAIFKNDNASKAYSPSGGVQLMFDDKAVSDKSLRITFSHAFQDPNIPSLQGDKKEYIQLNNFQNEKPMVVPRYNEHGISVVFDYKITRMK